MSVGELEATYLYPTPAQAKRAWERVAAACRGVSVNRYLLDAGDSSRQLVTVMTEEAGREAFERAVKLMAAEGEPIDGPPHALNLLRQKRVRQLVEDPDSRRIVRTEGGMVLGPGGVEYPRRRGQG